MQLTRRELLAGALAMPAPAARPQGIIIDTHIHLFDQKRFPYHPQATYKPPDRLLGDYTKFVREVKLNGSVIVHPEPYQDDHTYLEYAFAHEPWPRFFRGTCLFDPVDPKTPARMEALVKRNPGRIKALRIHENLAYDKPRTKMGQPIRDRDMRAPEMLGAWRKAGDLGMAIQMHFIPCHAPDIRRLAGQFRELPVILDHIGRYGEGTPREYEEVLRLSELPRVYMKLSAVVYSSREKPPHRDLQPLVRRIFKAFGPDRIIWGAIGMNREAFEQQVRIFDTLLDFASEADKAKIRGINAAKLYGFEVGAG
ncbi:MAG: amidohydrolase family protein [Bryobacterales bacterium]|nr:amidohydrolase family protein [Bryobacterales bacterium]